MNFIFCTDVYLLDINIQYLNHDYFTDIITFDNSTDKEAVEGDIYISVDRVNENAQDHLTSNENELLRVIIHGVLHLIGWGDSTDKQKEDMRKKESQLIERFYNVPRGTLNK